jgi:hypothetical protein
MRLHAPDVIAAHLLAALVEVVSGRWLVVDGYWLSIGDFWLRFMVKRFQVASWEQLLCCVERVLHSLRRAAEPRDEFSGCA